MTSERQKVKVVTAAKPYQCANDYAHDRNIQPGDLHVLVTEFPETWLGRWISGQFPIYRRLCLHCGADYGVPQ